MQKHQVHPKGAADHVSWIQTGDDYHHQHSKGLTYPDLVTLNDAPEMLFLGIHFSAGKR